VQTQEQSSRDDQATARQQLTQVLGDSGASRYAHLRALLDGAEAEPRDRWIMREEIRALWRWLEDAHGYLVAGPDESTDPRRLARRIHNQRLVLSDLNRAVRYYCAQTCPCMRKELSADTDADTDADAAALRAQVRRQRRALRWAQRRLAAQGEEVGRLLDRVIKQAATG
jgi:hypothetical protein